MEKKEIVTRFRDDQGSTGWIIWEGDVQYKGTKKPWVGVKWDDVSKGKSNGVVEDVKYFGTPDLRPYSSLNRDENQIKQKEGSYSFLLPNRIASKGEDLTNALQQRYGESEENTVFSMDFGEASKQKSIEVQLLGSDEIFKLQSKIDELQIASVQGSNASFFNSQSLQFKRLIELDLSDTLISSWTVVSDIIKHIPTLLTLHLDQNRFSESSLEGIQTLASSQITNVSLNRCLLDWATIQKVCANLFPKLEELNAARNDISVVTSQDVNRSGLLNLRVLNLEENSISSWKEVEDEFNTTRYPALEQLFLSNNKIADIRVAEQGASRLKTLTLDSNLIRNWDSVDELNHLPSLESLRLRQNPLNENQDSDTVRSIVIARIPKLTTLNGSSITAQERKDSEVSYLKQYIKQFGSQGELPARIQQLVTVYGTTEEAEAKHKTTLESNSVSVLLKCSTAETMDTKGVSKDLSLNMTVAKCKTLCCNLFHVRDEGDLELQFQLNKGSPSQKMNTDRTLSDYSVENGSIITLSQGF
eukprot:TRINITY_DN19221_c0_g1_i1.p1 TRINITY_DN19221_c0_g1~~TRINITY_DN19221_c0_g1_i1.p1  ORF type:complete len:530 (+),score=103.24 TRINITY_DN19221_c0_g1_i1:163-1752(+)